MRIFTQPRHLLWLFGCYFRCCCALKASSRPRRYQRATAIRRLSKYRGLSGAPRGGVLNITPAAAALVLAPNPATDAASRPEPRLVQLLGALGREARHQPVAANTTSTDLPLAGLAAGMYVVRCGLTTQRLVVE